MHSVRLFSTFHPLLEGQLLCSPLYPQLPECAGTGPAALRGSVRPAGRLPPSPDLTPLHIQRGALGEASSTPGQTRKLRPRAGGDRAGTEVFSGASCSTDFSNLATMSWDLPNTVFDLFVSGFFLGASCWDVRLLAPGDPQPMLLKTLRAETQLSRVWRLGRGAELWGGGV